ncbi:MAG: UDP-3-O-(3-hydroxymyristoyl)glucosamine N-acyltransferase, partial [Acetobacteraceae bacterium]|nr:UDP-3-O-(3-hydroxymyristoyl)glucosamine N-acyltransferase [Acetobacteraceae bacterium]
MTQTGDALPGDARFFAQTGPHSVGTVATVAGGEASGDRGRMLSGVAPLGAAGPEHVSYLDNPRYADALAATRAGAVLVPGSASARVPPGCAAI